MIQVMLTAFHLEVVMLSRFLVYPWRYLHLITDAKDRIKELKFKWT